MQGLFFIKRKRFWVSLLFSIILACQSVAFADDIDEIREIIKDGYFVPVGQEILDKPTIDEILEELDPYTEFFTKAEFDEFIKAIDMNYVGIGIIGEQHDQGVKVVYLFETGAAIKTALQVDDIIIEVNGTSLTGKTIDETQEYLLGSPGTTAHLKVFRPETNETLTIDVNRAKTEIASTVESAWLGGNIGYLRLNSFNEESVSELQKAMKSVGHVDGWIVDIRDNGGGYLDAAQDVAGLFPGVEVALIVEGQDHDATAFTSNKQNPQLTGPIFLLINADSASASEILAGAIQDQKAARLYGQTTFGKGVAQTVFELSSGNFFKMTVAQFYTPDGKVIDGIGIKPDVETEIGEELKVAHRDMLLLDEKRATLSGQKFSVAVPVNMEIAVQLNEVFSADQLKERVSLIELGGKSVEINVEPISLESFKITPTRLLKPESSYLLKIDSGIKDYILSFKTSNKIEEKNPNQEKFIDVKVTDFFAHSATVLYNEGLLKGIGEGKFGPEIELTREQAAVFFARILGLDTEGVVNPGFSDVKAGEYYYSSVAAVKKAGIMNGKSQNQFGTGDVLTRGEMAALLVRAFKLQAEDSVNGAGSEAAIGTTTAKPVAVTPFNDVAKSPFAIDILKLYQSGLAGGTTKTTYSPEKAVTRGEFVTFLYRALVSQGNNKDFAVLSVE
ncbi:MAG TPA: PDZ domain-containing protein [Bacillales bacterium]|nr:PDZ domain-containing protein [Bacillales bacterium]